MAAADVLSLRRYGASHGSHSHDHFQILIGLQGVLELEVAGHGRRIAEGDGCVVAPGERHDFESRHGSQCLVLDTGLPAWGARADGAPPTQAILALARYLASALTAGQPLARQLGPALLLESWGPGTGDGGTGRNIDWRALGAWAAERWTQPLTVADLAAQVHLSPTQLAARCRQAHGQSLMAWLRQQRLAQAVALRASGLSVKDVARRCGYRSASALTAALRRDAPLH